MVWYGSCMDPAQLLPPRLLPPLFSSMVWYGIWILYGPCSTSSSALSDFCCPSNIFPIYLHFFTFLVQKGTPSFDFWSQYTFSPSTFTTYTSSFFFPLLAPINIFCNKLLPSFFSIDLCIVIWWCKKIFCISRYFFGIYVAYTSSFLRFW